MSYFNEPYLTPLPKPRPNQTRSDALADDQSFRSHDSSANEVTLLENRSTRPPDLPHHSPFAMEKHRNLDFVDDILVIKTAEYIRCVGQVEFRLAVCLDQLASSFTSLRSILEETSPERLTCTKGKMERLRKPILNRLRDADWRESDLAARTQRWNNFLSWGRNKYRATITRERKDCDEAASACLNALMRSCVDCSTSTDHSLYPATNFGGIYTLYDADSANDSTLDTSVQWQTDPGSIATSLTAQGNVYHEFMPMSLPIDYSVNANAEQGLSVIGSEFSTPAAQPETQPFYHCDMSLNSDYYLGDSNYSFGTLQGYAREQSLLQALPPPRGPILPTLGPITVSKQAPQTGDQLIFPQGKDYSQITPQAPSEWEMTPDFSESLSPQSAQSMSSLNGYTYSEPFDYGSV